MQTIDRFAYCAGSHLFWTEHHAGQNSRGYSILSRISSHYIPGPFDKGWESLNDEAKDVYRAWCVKEGESCLYDSVPYLIEYSNRFDMQDDCVAWIMERCKDETINDTYLINYDASDFINLDMPYTSHLLRFYDDNQQSVLYWCDQYCDAIGANSRLHALEGQTIEDPDDMAAALVNMAMTYLARLILETLELPSLYT